MEFPVPPKVTLETVCVPSDEVVAREIEGQVIIVPLAAGIADTEEELFTLNESGQAIWRQLDGRRTLQEVAAALANDYGAPAADIERDVLGFAAELTERGLLRVKASRQDAPRIG
jgi:hypothetical protein